MFIVRKQYNGGASYLIKASESYETKYRWEKTARSNAITFKTRKTANAWATRMGGNVVKAQG